MVQWCHLVARDRTAAWEGRNRKLRGGGLSVTQTHQADRSGGQVGKWGLPWLNHVGGPSLGQYIEVESYSMWSLPFLTPSTELNTFRVQECPLCTYSHISLLISFMCFTRADSTWEWSWMMAVYRRIYKLSLSRGTPCGNSLNCCVKTKEQEKGRDHLWHKLTTQNFLEVKMERGEFLDYAT